MKALLIVAIVLVLLFVAGWLTFSNRDGAASINVETDRIKEDTSEMVEGGKRVFEKADEKVDVKVND